MLKRQKNFKSSLSLNQDKRFIYVKQLFLSANVKVHETPISFNKF